MENVRECRGRSTPYDRDRDKADDRQNDQPSPGKSRPPQSLHSAAAQQQTSYEYELPCSRVEHPGATVWVEDVEIHAGHKLRRQVEEEGTEDTPERSPEKDVNSDWRKADQHDVQRQQTSQSRR